MFLEQLDTIIAFAMVMLLLSLLITVGVQFIVSMLGIRGRNLTWGVTQLIRELDPENFGEDAKPLARKALSHPALAGSTNWLFKLVDWIRGRSGRPPRFNRGLRPPTAIRMKELALVLGALRESPEVGRSIRKGLEDLHRGDTPDASADAHGGAPDAPGATDATDTADETDIAAATDTAAATGDASEPAEPSTPARQPTDPVGEIERKLSVWFDIVMDATSERFKLRTRWITAILAAVLVFGWQVNSIDILQHLSEDSAVRDALIERIGDVEALYDSVYLAEVQESAANASEPGTDSVDATDAARQQVEDAGDAVETIMDELYQTEVVSFERIDSLRELGEDPVPKLATVLLLSLGAPFWYKVLNDFVGFRSVVARKQKEDETEAVD